MDSDTESSMICLLTSGALDYRYIQSFETPWAYFQNIQILEICFFFSGKETGAIFLKQDLQSSVSSLVLPLSCLDVLR